MVGIKTLPISIYSSFEGFFFLLFSLLLYTHSVSLSRLNLLYSMFLASALGWQNKQSGGAKKQEGWWRIIVMTIIKKIECSLFNRCDLYARLDDLKAELHRRSFLVKAYSCLCRTFFGSLCWYYYAYTVNLFTNVWQITCTQLSYSRFFLLRKYQFA